MSHYKPYPEYKDSGVEWIGEVPAHWGVVPGKALFIEKKRKNTDLAVGNYLSLVAGRGVIPYEEKGDIGNRKPDDLDRCKIVEPGDHVINSMNFSIGAYGRSRFSGVCSPVYVILGENNRRLGEGFGELILSNPFYQDFIQSFGSGILDHRRSIGWDEIKVAHVPCPPIQEQEEISALVHRETTRIDTLIEKKQRFIELLEEKRQAVITQAVTKGLDPNVPMKDSGVEWIGEVPAHWEVVKLRRLWRFISNGRVSTAEEETANSVAVSRIETISSGELNLSRTGWVKRETIRESDILRPGDILFSHINSLAVIGNCAEVPANVQIAHGINLLRIVPDSQTVPRFFLYLLRSRGIRSIISKTANPAINQASISVESLGEIQAVKLGFAEQSQIATFLDRETTRIDTLIEKTRESIDLLKERRSALITAAVTGKIDVREEAAA